MLKYQIKNTFRTCEEVAGKNGKTYKKYIYSIPNLDGKIYVMEWNTLISNIPGGWDFIIIDPANEHNWKTISHINQYISDAKNYDGGQTADIIKVEPFKKTIKKSASEPTQSEN